MLHISTSLSGFVGRSCLLSLALRAALTSGPRDEGRPRARFARPCVRSVVPPPTFGGPLGRPLRDLLGRLEGLLGRLEAILGVLD